MLQTAVESGNAPIRTAMMTPEPRPWSHSFFSCTEAAERFGVFAPLVAAWRGYAGDRALPCWDDVEITDFAGWHDMMVLDEIAHDPVDARTLIWGSRLAEIVGYQPRGLWLSESREVRGLIEEDFRFWERVCGEPCIGLARGSIDWRGRQHVVIERLYLPFARPGIRVDRVASFCRVVPD